MGEHYGYEDDVYGSCSCGELRPHEHTSDPTTRLEKVTQAAYDEEEG